MREFNASKMLLFAPEPKLSSFALGFGSGLRPLPCPVPGPALAGGGFLRAVQVVLRLLFLVCLSVLVELQR